MSLYIIGGVEFCMLVCVVGCNNVEEDSYLESFFVMLFSSPHADDARQVIVDVSTLRPIYHRPKRIERCDGPVRSTPGTLLNADH